MVIHLFFYLLSFLGVPDHKVGLVMVTVVMVTIVMVFCPRVVWCYCY